MNLSNPYEQPDKSDILGRELEASVLSAAARMLSRCAKNWDQRGLPAFEEQLNDALSLTQRVWTFLQVEICNPEHPMPASLRRNLFMLSQYVDQAIMKLYAGGALSDLQSLIDVNIEIASGLWTKDSSESTAAEKDRASTMTSGNVWA